jgi:2-keto-4-pentenoate hydratase
MGSLDEIAQSLYDLAHGAELSPGLADQVACRADLDFSLRVQLRVLDLWAASGESLAGWKVGLTSGKMRDSLGVGVRPFGYILASRVLSSGSRTYGPRFGPCRIEPEICLTMGSELAGSDVSYEQARSSVREVSAALEINEFRILRQVSPYLAVADDLGQWGIVTGDGVANAPTHLSDTTCVMYQDASPVSTVCPGGTLDDPFVTLQRLCGKLAEHGRGLVAGQRIITGSFSQHDVTRPGTWRATFSGLGSVQLQFEAK